MTALEVSPYSPAHAGLTTTSTPKTRKSANTKGKGKPPASFIYDSDDIDSKSEPEEFDEDFKQPKPKTRGCPRKDVLKDASKCIKKA